MSRPRLQPYVSHDVQKRLRAHCAARGVSESAFVEKSVREYLERAKGKAIIMQRLDRQARVIDRVGHDLSVLSEAFHLFVETVASALQRRPAVVPNRPS